MSLDLDRVYRYDPAAVEALRASYRHGGPLARPFYVSPDILAADLDRIWRRYWLYAGHSALIPDAGNWFTWLVGDDQIIVVRGKDGAIRAFHNTCRH